MRDQAYRIIAAPGAFVSRFSDAICASPRSAGAAMRRYSWTNNGLPLFSPGPCRAVEHHGVLSRHGRYSGRTATIQRQDGRLAAHARGDFGRALGQPFPSVRAADAVPVPEGAARRRLYRARFRAHGFRRGVRPDAGADRLSRRPYRRQKSPADRAHRRRRGADHARPASELHVADRLRRTARARQQRLSPLRLRDPVDAYG